MVIVVKLLRDHGTRPHYTHISFQDIEELRQLIKAGFSQESTYLRDPLIILQLESLLPFP